MSLPATYFHADLNRSRPTDSTSEAAGRILTYGLAWGLSGPGSPGLPKLGAGAKNKAHSAGKRGDVPQPARRLAGGIRREAPEWPGLKRGAATIWQTRKAWESLPFIAVVTIFAAAGDFLVATVDSNQQGLEQIGPRKSSQACGRNPGK